MENDPSKNNNENPKSHDPKMLSQSVLDQILKQNGLNFYDLIQDHHQDEGDSDEEEDDDEEVEIIPETSDEEELANHEGMIMRQWLDNDINNRGNNGNNNTRNNIYRNGTVRTIRNFLSTISLVQLLSIGAIVLSSWNVIQLFQFSGSKNFSSTVIITEHAQDSAQQQQLHQHSIKRILPEIPNGTNPNDTTSLDHKLHFLRTQFQESFIELVLQSSTPFLGHDLDREMIQSWSTLTLMGFHEWVRELAESWLSSDRYFNMLNQFADKLSTDDLIRYNVGPLLSAHAQSSSIDDKDLKLLFEEWAGKLTKLVIPAFDTWTTLPRKYIYLSGKFPKKPEVFEEVSLSEVLNLEFHYLSHVTGKKEYYNRIRNARKSIRTSVPPSGLYPNKMNVRTGDWLNETVSETSLMRNFYWNLLNSWIQSNDSESFQMYQEGMDSLEQKGLIGFRTNTNGTEEYFIKDFNYADGTSIQEQSKYDICGFGSMIALGASAMERWLMAQNESRNGSSIDQRLIQLDRIFAHWKLADGIVEQCHRFAIADSVDDSTGNDDPIDEYPKEDVPVGSMEKYYEEQLKFHQNQAQSYFILFRLTHNPKYRTYAWDFINTQIALYPKHWHPDPSFQWIRPMQYLATTFKYLYLTFSPESVLPLDRWVFTSAGQALPIVVIE